MIYLLLSVLFSTSLFTIFKYFEIYKVDTLKAIVVNYIVAFVLGFLLSENTVSVASLPNQPWLFGALTLGLLFIFIFFVILKRHYYCKKTPHRIVMSLLFLLPAN